MPHVVRRLLLGPRLPTAAESQERLTRPRAMGAFGLDALSSVAYGPDEILYALLLAGGAGLALDPPGGACPRRQGPADGRGARGHNQPPPAGAAPQPTRIRVDSLPAGEAQRGGHLGAG